MANKGMMLNVSLNEFKAMTPIEMFVFMEQMKEISKEMENRKNGI